MSENMSKRSDKSSSSAPLSGAELVNPYDNNRHKGEQVEDMFDSIAPAYDFMNTAMTFGLHRSWRSKALKAALRLLRKQNVEPKSVLDVATGTGDVAFHLHQDLPNSKIIGLDLSEGMLDVARRKLEKLAAADRELISFVKGDSLALPFDDNSFDLITVAYGVRNFEHLSQGYREMARVLRPGGVLCVIELSEPASPMLKFFYRIYSHKIIPTIGRCISGDSRAYSYLPESIAAAPQREKMCAIMREAGFENASWRSLTFGAVSYYLAEK